MLLFYFNQKALSEKEAEAIFLQGFPFDCREYIKIKGINKTIDGSNWRIDYIYKPYVLMNYLGRVLGGDDETGETGKFILSSLTYNNRNALKYIVAVILVDPTVSMGNPMFPHYIDTYYFITKKI